ncbi:hypothetical protein R3P38DRAFT_3235862 [Favolaschia claudopus]|uniref:Uncharacterized protein n=1 Tax=Favolaschia claudopus TaxID=2862362 RepID=A0AAV9ZDR2_9AGAR
MPADRTPKPATSSRVDLKKRKDRASDSATRMRAARSKIDALEKAIIAGILTRRTEDNNPVTISDQVREFTTAVARFRIDFNELYRSKSTESAQARVRVKCAMIKRFDEILKSHGSNSMSMMGGGRETETLIINPFRLDDPRRLEFDAELRKLVGEWQDVRINTLPPFDENKGIMFRMPNQFFDEWPKTDAGIARFLEISIYEEALERRQHEAVVAAKIRVPSVMPPPRAFAASETLQEYVL